MGVEIEKENDSPVVQYRGVRPEFLAPKLPISARKQLPKTGGVNNTTDSKNQNSASHRYLADDQDAIAFSVELDGDETLRTE